MKQSTCEWKSKSDEFNKSNGTEHLEEIWLQPTPNSLSLLSFSFMQTEHWTVGTAREWLFQFDSNCNEKTGKQKKIV